jgi:PmbA protein
MFDLARKLFNELSRRGVQEAEFYSVWGRSIVIDVSRNHVKNIVHRNITRYGVRGAYNKRVAGISSEDLSIEPSSLADELLKSIKASREISDWPGFSTGYSRGVMASIYDNKTANISIEDALSILKNTMDNAIDAAIKNGSEESITTRGSLTIGSGGVFIANIYGENLYEEYTFTNLALTVKSRKAGSESSFDAYISSRRINEEEFLGEARRAGEYSVKFINPKTIPSGEYTVVIDPYMTALFISSTLAPAFSALNVQERRSPLDHHQ